MGHYNIEGGSNVYACLLDASKAFDKINHGKLFRCLLYRRVPPHLIQPLIGVRSVHK